MVDSIRVLSEHTSLCESPIRGFHPQHSKQSIQMRPPPQRRPVQQATFRTRNRTAPGMYNQHSSKVDFSTPEQTNILGAPFVHPTEKRFPALSLVHAGSTAALKVPPLVHAGGTISLKDSLLVHVEGTAALREQPLVRFGEFYTKSRLQYLSGQQRTVFS